MLQKFRKLTFVKIDNEMPPSMAHFDKGFIGIVDGTYSQKYGGPDIKSYSIFKTENNKIINCISWYDESQLTALPDANQDTLRAEKMIEEYQIKR